MSDGKAPSSLLIILSFAALYVIWGSTYLGIKIAIETMPPFVMATNRFLLAGLILYGIARVRGVARPSASQWRHAFIVGSLLIAGGNGVVTYAEKWIDSSMAALVISSSPLFITLFSWWAGVLRRPTISVCLSLLGGFVGVGVLVFDTGVVGVGSFAFGSVLIVLAVISWAIGAVYSKKNTLQIDPWMQSGMQMICGGVVCLIMGLSLGEFAAVNVEGVSLRSWVAFGYLVLAGSLVGFTSYVYLLRHCSPTTVSSHAYVNPVVAVALGWLVLGETMSLVSSLGAGLILLSVFVLLRRSRV